MMTGLEGPTVAGWVYTTLLADADLADLLGGPDLAALRIVEGALPEDVPELVNGDPIPWVTFTVIEPRDVSVVGMIQVMAEVQVQVRLTVRDASYARLLAPFSLVHQNLHARANVPVSGGVILTSERVSSVQYPERANGLEYRHLGGLWRVHVQ